MKNQITKSIDSLFRLALSGLIKPDHVFPVILVYFCEGEITEDERVELQEKTELIEQIDQKIRDLLNRREKRRPAISDRMLRKVVLELINSTKKPFDAHGARVLKKRIMKDFGLSAKQLKG